MVLAAQSRTLDTRDVLSHPLGPVPWSIAATDGSPRKTNKSSLAQYLVRDVPFAEHIQSSSACIVDGMSLLQRAKAENKTFGQVAEMVMATALREGWQSQRIDIVFDKYTSPSIKDLERHRRGSHLGLKYKNISKGQTIHQWQKLLCSGDSKTAVVDFLVDDWRSPSFLERCGNKDIYVTKQSDCYHITRRESVAVPELTCDHEEADTRIFLHAQHAANNGYKSVIIAADDTDVLVIALGLAHIIGCQMYQRKRTSVRSHYIDVGRVANRLGIDLCSSLIGIHAFTGCDSVSAFAGKGKIKPVKILQQLPTYQLTFGNLGQSFDVTNQQLRELESFVCLLYLSQTTECSDINECRYMMFCGKKGEADSSQLPPCHDTLRQHVLRANYQAAIWRRSCQAQMDIPTPNGNGWNLDPESNLAIEWMTGMPAPQAVLDLLSCDCRRSCQAATCTCIRNGLKCTKMCRLENCENAPNDTDSCIGVGDIEDIHD